MKHTLAQFRIEPGFSKDTVLSVQLCLCNALLRFSIFLALCLKQRLQCPEVMTEASPQAPTAEAATSPKPFTACRVGVSGGGREQSCGLSFPESADSTHRAVPEPHHSHSVGFCWAARCCSARTQGFYSYHEVLFHCLRASCPRPGPDAVHLAVFAQPGSPTQVNASHVVVDEYDMGCDSMRGGAEQLQAP